MDTHVVDLKHTRTLLRKKTLTCSPTLLFILLLTVGIAPLILAEDLPQSTSIAIYTEIDILHSFYITVTTVDGQPIEFNSYQPHVETQYDDMKMYEIPADEIAMFSISNIIGENVVVQFSVDRHFQNFGVARLPVSIGDSTSVEIKLTHGTHSPAAYAFRTDVNSSFQEFVFQRPDGTRYMPYTPSLMRAVRTDPMGSDFLDPDLPRSVSFAARMSVARTTRTSYRDVIIVSARRQSYLHSRIHGWTGLAETTLPGGQTVRLPWAVSYDSHEDRVVY